MSVEWSSWSNAFQGPVAEVAAPVDLPALINTAAEATNVGRFLHAEGSRWAFSAPAYCEGTIVDTTALNGFPEPLQDAINGADEGDAYRVAVESGILLRDLYLGLARRSRPDGGPPADFLPASGAYVLPTMDGAGGQSIAGAISTGTHDGYVGQGSLSDCVLAMIIVGTGGEVRLLQRKLDPPVVDRARLEANFLSAFHSSISVQEIFDDVAFDAAVTSAGRFGIVWAYVLRVIDEHGVAIVQKRIQTTWALQQTTLAADVAAVSGSVRGFFQFVVNPHPGGDGQHTCWVTTNQPVPGDPDDELLPPELPNVIAARAAGGLEPAMQMLCAHVVTPPLAALRDAMRVAAIALLGGTGGVAAPLVAPLFAAAESIDRIGPDHLIGDAVADVLNLMTESGHPEFVSATVDAVLGAELSPTLADGSPWAVKGTRFEIGDFFDYDHDCFRGDSIEAFVPADLIVPFVDALLGVFSDLRTRGVVCGAYLAVRFMGQSRALLAPQRWPLTCGVEIAALRGLIGNFDLFREIQQTTLAAPFSGVLHWGQRNDCSRAEIEAAFGAAIGTWRSSLSEVEGASTLFSNPFSRSHGLEVVGSAPSWDGWEDLGLTTATDTAVASAGADQPLEAFARTSTGKLMSRQRRIDGTPDSPWGLVQAGIVDGAPVVVRARDGRLELFVCALERIEHIWQQDVPGGPWSGWDVLGSGDYSRVHHDDDRPSLTQHLDGRLELFVRGNIANGQPLLHAWAWVVNGPWTDLSPRGTSAIISRPASALRASFGDQIVCAALDTTGALVEKHQFGPGDDTGWTDWTPIATTDPSAPFPVPPGSLSAPIVLGQIPGSAALTVLCIDDRGAVWETVEDGRTGTLQFRPWQQLPVAPERIDPSIPLCPLVTTTANVFATTLTGSVLATALDPTSGWSAWQTLDGEVTGGVAAGEHADGRIEIIARRADNDGVVARRQLSPGRWS